MYIYIIHIYIIYTVYMCVCLYVCKMPDKHKNNLMPHVEKLFLHF